MYHSVAAVGINTSAQIESGIVGRPVFSVRVPEYAGTQEGTLHFHYLLHENGGLLHMAASLEDHVRDLTRAVDRTEEDDRRLRSFVEGFVGRRDSIGPRRRYWPTASKSSDGCRSSLPSARRFRLLLVRLVLYPIGTVMKVVRYVDAADEKARAAASAAHGRHVRPETLCRDSGALLPLGARQAVRAPLHRAARAAADDDRRHADAGDAADPEDSAADGQQPQAHRRRSMGERGRLRTAGTGFRF